MYEHKLASITSRGVISLSGWFDKKLSVEIRCVIDGNECPGEPATIGIQIRCPSQFHMMLNF